MIRWLRFTQWPATEVLQKPQFLCFGLGRQSASR